MKFTSAPSIVEEEVDTVKVQFNSLMPSLGILVSFCAGHPKTSEIRNAVKDAHYTITSYGDGSYCVTGGTPQSLETLADEIRAAYAGEDVDADTSKINEIVKLLILAEDDLYWRDPSKPFDDVKAAKCDRRVESHIVTAKKILEVLK